MPDILRPVRLYRPFLGSGYATPLPPVPAQPFETNLTTFLAAALPSIPCWHGKVPQKLKQPGIYWLIVDGDSVLNLSGASGGAWAHVKFTAASTAPGDIWSLAESLRMALQGRPGKWPGKMGTMTVQTVNVHSRVSDYTPAVDGTDRGPHQKSQEFYIFYDEPLA
jgi:hypothetical protein